MKHSDKIRDLSSNKKGFSYSTAYVRIWKYLQEYLLIVFTIFPGESPEPVRGVCEWPGQDGTVRVTVSFKRFSSKTAIDHLHH